MKHGLDETGRRSYKSIIVIAPLAILLYLMVMGIAYLIGDKIEDGLPEPTENYGNLDERFAPSQTASKDDQVYSHYESYYTNILVIGVDEDKLEDAVGYRTSGQADFLLYLVISRHDRSVTPIHIDRDTIAPVPVYGAFGDPAGAREMQVCLAQAFGGTQQAGSANTVQAVRSLMGDIKIDYYLTVDMEGIAELNDALGGVTVTLEEDFSHLDPEMTEGATITLQGKQAEYYVRGRYGIGDYSNSQRMKHQQTFIDAAVPLLHEHMSEDDSFVLRVFDDLSEHLCTNLSRSWLMSNTYAFSNYEINPIVTLEGEHKVGADGFMEFWPDEDALEQLLIDLFYE